MAQQPQHSERRRRTCCQPGADLRLLCCLLRVGRLPALVDAQPRPLFLLVVLVQHAPRPRVLLLKPGRCLLLRCSPRALALLLLDLRAGMQNIIVVAVQIVTLDAMSALPTHSQPHKRTCVVNMQAVLHNANTSGTTPSFAVP